MDAVVVIQVFRFDLFIRADQPELPRQCKRRIHAVDDSPKDGVGVYVVIRQLKQTVDIALLVAQDAVIVVTGEVARVGDGPVVIGHRLARFLLRTDGNLGCPGLPGLIPRLRAFSLSVQPAHVIPPNTKGAPLWDALSLYFSSMICSISVGVTINGTVGKCFLLPVTR